MTDFSYAELETHPMPRNFFFGNDPWVHYTRRDKMDDGTIDLATDPTRRCFKGVSYHGDLEFDVPFMTEVTTSSIETALHPLWQGGVSDGLVLPEHIKHLVSLYVWEKYRVKHEISTQMYVQMSDSLTQGFDQLDALAQWVNHCRTTGPVLVHCQAGLNRSSLVIARALYLSEGWPGEEIVELLRAKRSPAVLCNTAFEAEVRSWA